MVSSEKLKNKVTTHDKIMDCKYRHALSNAQCRAFNHEDWLRYSRGRTLQSLEITDISGLLIYRNLDYFRCFRMFVLTLATVTARRSLAEQIVAGFRPFYCRFSRFGFSFKRQSQPTVPMSAIATDALQCVPDLESKCMEDVIRERLFRSLVGPS